MMMMMMMTTTKVTDKEVTTDTNTFLNTAESPITGIGPGMNTTDGTTARMISERAREK